MSRFLSKGSVFGIVKKRFCFRKMEKPSKFEGFLMFLRLAVAKIIV